MYQLLLDGDAAATESTGTGLFGGNQMIITIVMLVAMVGVFYFFLYRPQKKQEKKQKEMMNALSVGDEITTIGGIVGRVVSIKDEIVSIETSKDRTRVSILRSAIRSVDVKAEDAAD